jgi:hypothetical protein
MPETPSLDPRRTGDPVATTDEPLAVPDCAGGLRTPAGASNRAARYLLGEEIARGPTAGLPKGHDRQTELGAPPDRGGRTGYARDRGITGDPGK